jgi:tRNA-Thr(GGU) m(6)t(6)A37 methyltransferase TsaA
MKQTRPRAATSAGRLRPIGVIRSTLKSRKNAPRQGAEGAPDAWLEIRAWAMKAVHLLEVGDQIIVITWFHRAKRDVLQVHPRGNLNNPLTGVFATRSPDRPNPLGLHPVTVRAIEGRRLRVGPIEAIDGTPVVDIKPALKCSP